VSEVPTRRPTSRRPNGEHPNSLAASRDPAIAQKIREGRKRADDDLLAMNKWGLKEFGINYSKGEGH
jgi:hypothetical protein